jgi:hypothetical protein
VQLASLRDDLRAVASRALDELPTYGIFSAGREPFENRVIIVGYERESGRAVGFTALVYLPPRARSDGPIVHLGLTMIARDARRQRLQTELFKKAFVLPIVNQRRLHFTITNIAASPAGVGATSDYFDDVYPHYDGVTALREWHLAVADHVLASQRHEFGCSVRARFDPRTFVVHCSNEPEGGGAHQLIQLEPSSRYRVERCNDYCRELLDLTQGDELFQVGRLSVLSSLRRSSDKVRKAG